MKISRATLLSSTPQEAADLLYEAGKSLRGVNLKKSSWLLIASSLHIQRASDILLSRLEAAATREHALRVLRIARKQDHRRIKSSGKGKSQGAKENLLAVAFETSPERDPEEDDYFLMLQQWDEEFLPYYEDWLIEQGELHAANRKRYHTLLAVSNVQETIHHYAWERLQCEHPERDSLRSRLNDETYHRLLDLIGAGKSLDLNEDEQAFLQEHGLDQMLQYAKYPKESINPHSVCDGISLVGLSIIQTYTGPKNHPFTVDWDAVVAWLIESVMAVPKPETRQAVIAGAYIFFRDAPAQWIISFLQRTAVCHSDWTSLLGYAYQRIPEILPADMVDRSEYGMTSYFNRMRWERLLDARTGSSLADYALRKNIEGIINKRFSIADRYKNRSTSLLMAGGGMLLRMDYPSFTLICRPSISLVRLETLAKLVDLAMRMVRLRDQIVTFTQSSLAQWIEETYLDLSNNTLPAELALQVASSLEQHAIAYLMLKEHVLRDVFQAAPFRLRRKHIERFWQDHETLETLPFTIASGFQDLRAELGDEALLEALAHALLDHFKDDWDAPEPVAKLLKETLLRLLRSAAIVFRLQQPWLPPEGRQVREDDLERTGDIVNFLIQQTENAPLELSQALLIDPQQGLPRLAGGRLTDLEADCRRLMKVIAGVSQEKISGGQARVFTCRPISKIAALDRGNLAGDCSSGSVPLRSLSPHHTYYGIFENDVQQRGYMTVYEAWAVVINKKGEETGERFPVLCLETINVPIRVFDSVQQDLLVIFEAVARSRGLSERLVLITSSGTWNYQNGEVLRQSRRARQGKSVRLFPADPAIWSVYKLLTHEGNYYTAFYEGAASPYYRDNFRLLDPLQPDIDQVEPENLAEAQRIATLPPKRLCLTARDEHGPAGFISEFPEIL
jgi:hypothetical protein